MLKEMINQEIMLMGNEDFKAHAKGLSLCNKIDEIMQVHDEIKDIEGENLKPILILKVRALKYVEKCNSYGLNAKMDGLFGITFTLPDEVKETELIEKIAILNKVFYEVKSEKLCG